MDLAKKFKVYADYPCVRRSQFVRLADASWEDTDGNKWMRARPFVPEFAETIPEVDIRNEMMIAVPHPSSDGGTFFWMLLKKRQPLALEVNDNVTFDNTVRRVKDVIYKRGHRTVLVELA
jgi:hypothetical protein